MPQFAAVNATRHAGKRWHRFNNYSFAAAQNVVPLFGTELSQAACSMPLAFIEQGGCYTLVALLSVVPGRNLFVAPDGRWLCGYVPSLLRAYPFGIVPKPDSNAFVLCVDEDKLASDGQAGELFFDDKGKLSPAVQPIFDMLAQLERSRVGTDKAVSALAETGLIQPWPITVNTARGAQPISGLYRIDEVALNALSDERFLKLRKELALPIAFVQLSSMAQVSVFTQLTNLHAQLTQPQITMPKTLDSIFSLPNDDTIQFR